MLSGREKGPYPCARVLALTKKKSKPPSLQGGELYPQGGITTPIFSVRRSTSAGIEPATSVNNLFTKMSLRIYVTTSLLH